MTRRVAFVMIAVALLGPAALAQKIDITGKWTASFETQVGTQNYTYEFVVKDGKLTGTAVSNLGGPNDLKNGKVEGDTVTFGETLRFMDMDVEIQYTGKIVSAEEIKFTRQVADVATEELVAKRSK